MSSKKKAAKKSAKKTVAKAKPKKSVAKAKPKKSVAKAKPKKSVAKAKPKKTVAKAPARAPAAKAKAKAKAKAPAKAKASALRRRDGTGHLDPKYAADLRAKSRESAEDLHVDRAFLRVSKSRGRDALGEELGEEAVMTMTSAEDQSDQLQEREVEEEIGGPFVITTGSQEFARGTDRSNPRRSTREPFPKT